MHKDPMKVRSGDLRQLPLFQGVSVLKLRKITPLCRKRLLPKNTVIFLEDEPAAHLYFVLKGNVAVTMGIEGHRTTMYDVNEMQCFGWSALVPPHLFAATAQCTQPSLVLEVDAVALRKRLIKDHRLGNTVMSTLARILHSRLNETRRFFLERLSAHAPPAIERDVALKP